MRRPALAVIAAIALTASSMMTAGPASGAPDQAVASRRSYIVTVESGTAPSGPTARAELNSVAPTARPTRVFRHALPGYTASLTPQEAVELAATPGVTAVEPDGIVRASATQPNAPWGLDRIDQRSLPLSTTYTYGQTGTGVTAYVVDSGLRASHVDFGGRALTGTDVVDGGAADDCFGHGTHVASTLGGTTYGAAKAARLVAVRVLDCTGVGTTSMLIAGIDWIVAHHGAGQPAVANLSLGAPASTALDQAIARLAADGVTVVAAAGNTGTNACNLSPARSPAAIAVAASDRSDRLASFSNVGPCVDVIAPGVGIVGAWHTGDTASATSDGTSMAAPHVAGTVAKVLQMAPSANPLQLAAWIRGTASVNKVSGTVATCSFRLATCKPATPNYLLFG